MISVKKDFDNPPPVLLTGKEDAWRDPSVMTELKRLYHGKCAYCETKTDDLVIDHYRPKSKYPWLANEWSNLLPACVECNNAKGDEFPVRNEHLHVYDRQKEERYITELSEADRRANSSQLLKEDPRLLHPEIDTVENHLTFTSEGKLYSHYSDRGLETIQTIALDRETLVSKRKELYQELSDGLKELIRGKNLNYYAELKNAAQPDHEFSALGSILCYNFEKLLWKAAYDELKEYRPAIDENTGEETGYGEQYNPYEQTAEYCRFQYFKEVFNKSIGEPGVSSDLPLSVVNISVRNFQGIKEIRDIDIPLNTQWVFLTGENGFGKTSVLRAILLGLVGRDTKPSRSEATRVELDITYNKSNSWESNFGVKRNSYSSEHFDTLNHVAAYGANRTKLDDDVFSNSAIAHLFGEEEKVLNVEKKILNLDGEKEFEPLQSELMKVIKLLVPKIGEIKIESNFREKKREVMYYEKDDDGNLLPPVRFQDLALGMRGIIGLVGDIILRLSDDKKFEEKGKSKGAIDEILDPDFYLPRFSSTKDLEGIVLIDEFDNHLHPKWQRRLVEKLTELFPKVQFIVSTHSPIPLLGAPVDRTVILNVNRTKEEGITVKRLEEIEKALPNMLPNVLLTSPVFGMDSIRQVHNKNIQDVNTDEDYLDEKTYENLERELDEYFVKRRSEFENSDLFKES